MPRDPVVGLGQRIRERRHSRGMKLATLARKAGISSSYLCEVETTEGTCPSAVVLYKIARALDTTIPYLLNLPDHPGVATNGRALPPTLIRAKVRYHLADDEVELLNHIDYRGKRPQTEEDWFFLLCAIRRAVS